MTRTNINILDYYNSAVVEMISSKYGMSHSDAFSAFAKSKTHRMLSDSQYEMWQFGAPAIFEIWEAEKITGDPKNSSYIIGE